MALSMWGSLARQPVHLGDLEIEAVAKILALFKDVLEEGAVGFVLHHWLDQIDLVHRHKLQYFGARLAGGIARQRMDDLDMLGRLDAFGGGKRVAQLLL